MKHIKLKPITERIAVHTPTEEEAKELLSMLHANGYKWYCGDSLIKQNYWYEHKHESAYSIKSNKSIGFSSCSGYKGMGVKILSLAEFVVEYVDIKSICDEIFVAFTKLQNDMRYVWKPQPTEDMETSGETGKNSKKSQLNLCELLKGHEGEKFYSSLYDNMVDIRLYRDVIDITFGEYNTSIFSNGAYYKRGVCTLFPSRTLYEQHPLDATKAWSVWEEEQKRILMSVTLGAMGDGKTMHRIYQFRTPADRDKCISKIKAILEKYSKK